MCGQIGPANMKLASAASLSPNFLVGVTKSDESRAPPCRSLPTRGYFWQRATDPFGTGTTRGAWQGSRQPAGVLLRPIICSKSLIFIKAHMRIFASSLIISALHASYDFVSNPWSEPSCVTRRISVAGSNSHTVAVRSAAPLSRLRCGKAQENGTILKRGI